MTPLLNFKSKLDYYVSQNDKHEWTDKLIRFTRLMWFQQYLFPDLQKELATLAFESCEQILRSVINIASFQDDFVKTKADAEEIEKRLCVESWDYASSLAANHIPLIFEEKIFLLNVVDGCAKQIFRNDIRREQFEIKPQLGVEESNTLMAIEEIERIYFPGRDVDLSWIKLKFFSRPADSFYYYDCFIPNFSCGSNGIKLVRNGYVIGQIDLMIA